MTQAEYGLFMASSQDKDRKKFLRNKFYRLRLYSYIG